MGLIERLQSKDAGIDIKKPSPNISKLFSDILKQLEDRKTYRWTEIGVILNMFSPNDQTKLSKMILKLKNNVRKNWYKEGHKNTAVIVPPKASEFSLCYVVYNNSNSHMRDEFIQNASSLGLEPEHVKKCLIIAKNMDKTDLSYHFIGLVE